MHGFARVRIVPRAAPLADILPIGAGVLMPVMQRGAAQGIHQIAAFVTGEHADGDRRVGRPERRRADLRDIPAQLLRHDRQRIDVAGFALIGAHAHGGIALQMLH